MKKFYSLLSVLLSITLLLVSFPIMGIMTSADTATETVIFAANPAKVGGAGANATATTFDTTGIGSAAPVMVTSDAKGEYYHIEADASLATNNNARYYFKSGYTSADLPWLNDPTVISVLYNYIQVKFSVRATDNSGDSNKIFKLGVADRTANLNNQWSPYTHIFHSEGIRTQWVQYWIERTSSREASAVASGAGACETFKDGYIFFNTYISSDRQWSPTYYNVDIRDIRFTISTADYAAIDAALEQAGSNYTVAKLLADWKNANISEEVIFAANPNRIGDAGDSATATYFTENPKFSSFAPVIIRNDENGEYYHIEATANGSWNSYSYFKSGYTSADLPWIADAKVTNAILPFIKFNYKYRIYMQNGTTTSAFLSMGVADSRANNWEHIVDGQQNGYYSKVILYSNGISTTSSWQSGVVIGKNITQNNFSYFSDGYVFVCAFPKNGTMDKFITDVRDVSFTISSADYDAIDAALEAVGSEWTIEKIVKAWKDANAKTYKTVQIDADSDVEVTFNDNVIPSDVQTAKRAPVGETVTMTVALKRGYNIGSVSITDKSGNSIAITKVDDITYTFTMPQNSVIVSIEKSLPGDYNDDGAVNILDLVRLKKYFAGCTTDIALINDFEINGIGTDDLIMLRRALLSGIKTRDDSFAVKSVTMTYYDEECKNIGLTWNSNDKLDNQVVRISEGERFNEESFKEFSANTKTYTTNDTNGSYDFYVSKAVITDLVPGQKYTYNIYHSLRGYLSDDYTFTFADSDKDSFTFAHLADSQIDDTTHVGTGTGVYLNRILETIEKNNPNLDFYLHTGDIVHYSKYEAFWDNMIDYNKKFFTKTPMMAISGNHETEGTAGTNGITKHFNNDFGEQNTDKGYYYYFDYNNTKFIMINTVDNEYNGISDSQLVWLENVLKNNTQKWTIVSMHVPLYSVGQSGQSLNFRNQLAELFAKYNVDLVIQGHDHCYSETYPIDIDGNAETDVATEVVDGVNYYVNPNGVVYSMHGPTGDQTRNIVTTSEIEKYAFSQNSHSYSWSEITVTDSSLKVTIYYYNNGNPKIVYSYGIKKN